MTLTGKQKRHLRGLAHKLRPDVMLGKQGVSDGVLGQVEESLLAHELVKVRVLEGCPVERKAAGPALAEATQAALVQILGRTLVLYRPNPEKPTIVLPD